ncbi:MAG: sporulation protein [Pseudobutyrivibrio sp.]|nr:sporulation protein [Pseudobutyrivibrio sp.]
MSNEMFNDTMKSLMDSMNAYLSTKTVVGEPMEFGDTTIIPMVNVSFGMGCGTLRGEHKADAGGGIGGKLTPSAVIVLKNGTARVINISTNSGMEKLIDMVPDLVATVQGKIDSKGQTKEARKGAKDIIEDAIDPED